MDGTLTERAGSSGITPVAELHIDDLALRIDGAEQGALASTDFEIGFVDVPPTTKRGAVRPRYGHKPQAQEHAITDH